LNIIPGILHVLKLTRKIYIEIRIVLFIMCRELCHTVLFNVTYSTNVLIIVL